MAVRGEHVLLIGTMGSGKSTVGRALAERLGRPHLDSDDAVEQATGASTLELLTTDGLDALHAAEWGVLSEQLAGPPAVISVAGSAVDDPSVTAALRGAGEVIYLRAEISTLLGRLAADAPRPIPGEAAAVIPELDARRREHYEQLATLALDVEGRSPAELATAIIEGLARRVEVPLGERSYEVVIGPGVRHLLASVLPLGARRAAIVTQEGIGVEVDPGIESATFYMGDGEDNKSLSTIEELCRGFARFGLTRADVVIGVGGGVVTDVAGFAASCYHRGMAVVHVSTSLLGQVDAAVGGKTGVNLPEGKNLVGAFWQPQAVLCDTATLDSLPARERRSGSGEMAKYAFLGVEELDQLPVVEQVRSCVELKAEVVAEDEREGDRRMLLNYGHTLAHALEAAGFADGPGRGGIDLRHGEAVAIGLVFAARLAEHLGRIDAARVARHLEVVRAYDLPAELPEGVDHEELLVLMGRDKKATAGLTFVLDGDKGVEVVRDVPLDAVRATLARCGPGSAR